MSGLDVDYIFKALSERIDYWRENINHSWNESELIVKENSLYSYTPLRIRDQFYDDFEVEDTEYLARMLGILVRETGRDVEIFTREVILCLDHFFKLTTMQFIPTNNFREAIKPLRNIQKYIELSIERGNGLTDKKFNSRMLKMWKDTQREISTLKNDLKCYQNF